MIKNIAIKKLIFSAIPTTICLTIASLYASNYFHSGSHDLILISSISTGALVSVLLFLLYFSLKRLDKSITTDRLSLLEEKDNLIKEHQKQTEIIGNIEAKEKQWEATMDCVEDMVILTDNLFVIIRCNRAVLHFTGLAFSDILGKRLTEILELGDFKKNESADGSYEYFHAATGKWLYLNIYPVKDDSGSLDGTVITMHDLSEIKKVSSELEAKNVEIDEQRRKLKKALSQISDLIQSVVDEKRFDIFFKNPNLSRCWQKKECEKQECPCHGKEPMRCWHAVGTFCQGKEQGEFVEKYRNCLECAHYQEITKDPVYLIGEQFNNMMHILAQKNAEVLLAYDELKQTQAQLLQQEKMASIGQLAAGVAHEINNPIGFVLSNLGSLSKYTQKMNEFIEFQSSITKEINDQEKTQALQEMRKKLKLDLILSDITELISESLDGCLRVKKIVQDLKGFSRVDQAAKQVADLNECIETTLNIIWNELKYKATIEKDYGEVKAFECFPQQLNQVFMNLLINAVHAFDEEGTITIKTWQEDEFVCASVSDNGKGIPPQHLSHIFEPFFTTKEVSKGTGLGLSIVYDIIKKNHNGDIHVVSVENEGTTFTIKIPIPMG